MRNSVGAMLGLEWSTLAFKPCTLPLDLVHVTSGQRVRYLWTLCTLFLDPAHVTCRPRARYIWTPCTLALDRDIPEFICHTWSGFSRLLQTSCGFRGFVDCIKYSISWSRGKMRDLGEPRSTVLILVLLKLILSITILQIFK